jgi:hypothetical protein
LNVYEVFSLTGDKKKQEDRSSCKKRLLTKGTTVFYQQENRDRQENQTE